MSYPGYEFFSTVRINRMMRALVDVRGLPQDLVFLGRTPVVPALEGEVIARYVMRVLMADLIADDAAAATYQMGKLQPESYPVPNLKVGCNFTQAQIAELRAILSNPGLMDDEFFNGMLMGAINAVRQGILQRMEQLCVAMWLDEYNYDRLGIKLQGVTWGMPADLKVTTSIPWTDAANATPVNDIWAVKLVAQQRYGIIYDRVTMSTQAFRYMIATTEFQAKARMFLAPNVSFTNLQLTNIPSLTPLAQNILGADVEFYDARPWSQDGSGVTSSSRFWPINKVGLSAKANDNRQEVWDFANVPVIESMVASLMPTSVGNVGGMSMGVRGPVAYATVPPALNPPNLTIWGVARGFPRRYMLQATAALTVGYFNDAISTTEPF
jgi:hypothetical protein